MALARMERSTATGGRAGAHGAGSGGLNLGSGSGSRSLIASPSSGSSLASTAASTAAAAAASPTRAPAAHWKHVLNYDNARTAVKPSTKPSGIGKKSTPSAKKKIKSAKKSIGTGDRGDPKPYKISASSRPDVRTAALQAVSLAVLCYWLDPTCRLHAA